MSYGSGNYGDGVYGTGIDVTSLTSGTDTGDKTSYATASITPGANKLILLVVANGHTGGSQTAPSSVTGNGLTWVQVGTAGTGSLGGNQQVTIYRAMGPSPTTGVVTINFAGQQHNCLWEVFQVTGIDTSGTNGSGAVTQAKTASGTGSALSATLDSAVGNGGASFGAFVYNSSNDAATAGSGYVELGAQAGSSSPSIRRFCEWRAAGSQAVNASVGVSTKYAIVALEFKQLFTGASVSKESDLRWTVEAAAQNTWDVTEKLDETVTGDTADAKDTGTRGFSGLVASKTYPGIFYMHPDHPQPDGRIYAVRLEQGEVGFVTGTTRYKRIDVDIDADEDDWEDITIDGTGRLYVWGNGSTNLVYRFPEVDPRTSATLSSPVNFTLDPPSSIGGSQESIGSCETIFWFNSDIYWINKVDPDTAKHQMYKRPAAGGSSTDLGPLTEPSGGFGSTGRICGGDVSEDGKRLAIVNKYSVFVYEGTDPADAVSRAPAWVVDFKDPGKTSQALTESVAFVPGTYDIYIMNEGTSSGPAWFKYLPAAAYGPGTPGQSATSVTKSSTLRWGVEQADDAAGTGCMFGAHVEGNGFAEDTWENTRKTLAVVRAYYQPEDWGVLPDDEETDILALEQGRTVMVSWKHGAVGNDGNWVGSGNVGWQEIANGDHDVFIDALAKVYEPYGRRVIFVFNHEPHDDPSKAKDKGVSGNDSTDSTAFKNAFRRIAAKMRDAGVLVGYCATASKALAGTPKGNNDLLYPGNEHLDVECHDHYNWYTFDDRTWENSAEDGWLDVDEMSLRRGHPLVFGEWSSHPGDATHNRKTYFTASAAWLKTRPNIRGFCLYESDHTHNWLTTADELSAFTTDSYFSSTNLFVLPADAPVAKVGKNVEAYWNVTGAVGVTLTPRWNVQKLTGAAAPANARDTFKTRIRVRSVGRNRVS